MPRIPALGRSPLDAIVGLFAQSPQGVFGQTGPTVPPWLHTALGALRSVEPDVKRIEID